MTDQLCDICKKEPVRIQITGEGKYCLNCYNELMMKEYGLENTFDYPETVMIMEPDGTMHTFHIEHVLLGDIVSWDAYEQRGKYHFREISDIDANGSATAKKFIRKIADGVCTKSLHENAIAAGNICYKDGKWLTLRNKGTINIIEDEDREYQIAFEINGKVFSGQELEKLLGGYQGFCMKYQIEDASEPVLKEDEYLVPVYITKKSLIDELKSAIELYGDRGFISYDDTMEFDEAFFKITDKLAVLARSEKRNSAIEAGREMVRILTQIETDDDYFPIPDIQLVCRIVDPFGIDEELAELCEKFFSDK